VIEDISRHHDFVGAGFLDERIEPSLDALRRADDRAAQRLLQDRLGARIEPALEIFDRGRQRTAAAGTTGDHRLLVRAEQPRRLLVGVRRADVEPQHDMGNGEPFRRLEAAR